ncbi:uncharacterized protein BKA55DRAFT_542590 [Fusarium redolens]|uniref:Uncharacterized protein n=1 Tax=Fusarium redolens TaxID=48865 RepID=A0A9P9GJV9_FUSRE|nr:uncharacterized protein BKA55DRAFT_542590 [Fusarium redolens]KAH7239993.1 hypothetical protein BKA55DRAFT_542590 [Fusarium redolens]
MTSISEMIDFLWRPPQKEPGVKSRLLDRKDSENFQYYHNWGFTVYQYSKTTGNRSGVYMPTKAMREDLSLLDGLDITQIQELYREELPEARKNIEGTKSCFIFVADESVLRDIARGVFVIKVVGYDWDEDRAGQGWMRIPTGDVLSLWETLLLYDYMGSDVYEEIDYLWFGEELEKYTWPGDASIYPTGGCSEARTAYPRSRPGYSQFRLDY